MKYFSQIVVLLFILLLLSNKSFTQDAAKVDSKHYKVEFENDEVRVLRITYAPGEKGVMHSHPEGMVIFLTDSEGQFTLPDGKTQKNNYKKGFFSWVPASIHQPENIGKKPFELIQIEMKSKKKK